MVATSRRAPLKVILAKPRSAATAIRISAAVAGARRVIRGRQTPAPRMKPCRGLPMTLGNAAAAMVRLIGWL
jgi:hypothetical protein